MMSYQPWIRAREVRDRREERDIQALIPSVSPFPPVQPVSLGYGPLSLIRQLIQDRFKL